MWSPQGVLPAPAPASRTGRIGLFVGGFFALFLVSSISGTIVSNFLDDGASTPARTVAALVTASFAGGLLLVARRWRHGELEPLAVMAAFGATGYVAQTVQIAADTAGMSGDQTFWAVVLASLVSGVAILLWLPHPVLGVSVGLAAIVAAVAAPVGWDGPGSVSTRAFLLAAFLLVLALVVDLRTRSRAGSFLHYEAVVALVVAKIAFASAVEWYVSLPIILGMGIVELFVALVDRRRSWGFSAWVTIQLALVGYVAVVFGWVGIDWGIFGLPAPAILVAAFVLQRREEQFRGQLVELLPRSIADRLPS